MGLAGDDIELRSPDDPTRIARLALARPLDLGLEIEPDIYFPTPASIPLGDPDFDRAFRVTADDAERARALAARELRRHVLGMSHWARVSMSDAGIVLRKKPWTRPRSTETVIAELRALAGLVEAGRDRCPLPAPLVPSEQPLEALAADLGLTRQRTPLALTGRAADLAVTVRTWRVDRDQHGFSCEVLRDAPLGARLSLAPSTLGLRWTAPFRTGARADRAVGDLPFDEAFDVRCPDPRLPALLLDAPTRTALAACAAACEGLVLDDDGALGQGTCNPDDPDRIPRVTRALCTTLRRVAESLAAARAGRRGPYR